MQNLDNLDGKYGLDWGKMGDCKRIIAVTQEVTTGKIIAVGAMSQSGLEINLRSKKNTKGWRSKSLSGQAVITSSILVDCDCDTLLFGVEGVMSELNSLFVPILDWERLGQLGRDAENNVITVAQDYTTQEVLMVGVSNNEAIQATVSTGLATFFSRTRGEIWQKGATSGNCLKVRTIMKDFSSGAIILSVEPMGPVCHTGAKTCFREVSGNFRNYIKEKEK